MHITGSVKKGRSKTKFQFPAMLRRVESSIVIEISKNRSVLLFSLLLNYIYYIMLCCYIILLCYIMCHVVLCYILYYITILRNIRNVLSNDMT